MRLSMTRHLGSLTEERTRLVGLAVTAESDREVSPVAPPEFNAQDYVSYLLDIDAEIEHSLMVQYLYAAYSLGGPQVPEKYRDQIRGWQEIVLGIAKEEMGHLMSVQNVLRLIGAPLNLVREDYPWDSPFYPYPFMLEPLTPQALAKYIFAESPVDWSGPLAEEIKKLLPKTKSPPHRVAELLNHLIDKVRDPNFLPDEVFQADTWPYQAKWDEWGRGYQKGARGNADGANLPETPDVLVRAVASRDDAVDSLTQIAEQGEACPDASLKNPSHFARFLKIYQEMKKLMPIWNKAGWQPWRNVAVNPYIPASDGASSAKAKRNPPQDPITHPEAIQWGYLFNVRYRMVLTYLTHTFEVAGGLNGAGLWTPRGTIISATFGEMYNMRAIANFMVQTPLSAGSRANDKSAGPPFQMPYTLNRPMGDANRWRQHKCVLQASEPLIANLLAISAPTRHRYLYSLREADQQLIRIIDRILAGQTNLIPR